MTLLIFRARQGWRDDKVIPTKPAFPGQTGRHDSERCSRTEEATKGGRTSEEERGNQEA